MKVLLLGPTGNLGSRLLPALLSHGHTVIVFVRSESKLRSLIPSSVLSSTTVVTGDATDAAAIKDALVTHKCNALVNAAGLAAVFPWQAPKMQGIVRAVVTAGVEASKTLRWGIRVWVLGGLGAMDYPDGGEGVKLVKYFPFFPEHELTYALLLDQPPENLKWSMCCPGVMAPAEKEIVALASPRGNKLKASADVPPEWQHSMFRGIPFVGPVWNAFTNLLRYNIKLEDCADFIAADLEAADDKFVGKRVGLIEVAKGKDD